MKEVKGSMHTISSFQLLAGQKGCNWFFCSCWLPFVAAQFRSLATEILLYALQT